MGWEEKDSLSSAEAGHAAEFGKKSISIFVVFPQEWGGEEFCLTH
jgi:hypothetical protein